MASELTTDSAVDDLATMLFALEGRLTTTRMTRKITNAIAQWALARGWFVRTEARVAVAGAEHEHLSQLGFVDVVIRRGESGPDIAIEIDSAHKPWSVDKLRHAAEAGMHSVWVRWGDEDWPGVHDDIDVIQLRLPRSAGHRPTVAQISLWPDRAGSVSARKAAAFRPTTPSTTD